MPAWLTEDAAPDSPWATREEFLDHRNGPKAAQLRRLLIDTVALQAEFMITRLEAAQSGSLEEAGTSPLDILDEAVLLVLGENAEHL